MGKYSKWASVFVFRPISLIRPYLRQYFRLRTTQMGWKKDESKSLHRFPTSWRPFQYLRFSDVYANFSLFPGFLIASSFCATSWPWFVMFFASVVQIRLRTRYTQVCASMSWPSCQLWLHRRSGHAFHLCLVCIVCLFCPEWGIWWLNLTRTWL